MIIKTFQYRLYFVVGYLKNSLKLALSSYIQQGIITLRPHFIINHLILFVPNEQHFMVFPFEIVQFIGGNNHHMSIHLIVRSVSDTFVSEGKYQISHKNSQNVLLYKRQS